ncbi:efflux transporter%2C RND family%2C MFP subunit [Chlamydia trachomatis]|nr:efflux transporter%2C RND family%2C MFP subunit [Chlamydia trachomatis]
MDAHPRRRFVMQIIRIAIWTIIAIALIKVAFFPNQEKNEGIIGQGNFELPTVEVTRGSIENTQEFEATVLRDDAKPIKSSAEGTIVKIFTANGAAVNEGDRILQVRSEVTVGSNNPEEGASTAYKWIDIYAPTAGTVRVDAIENQTVSVGEALGEIEATTFHASVQLTPDKLYRLQGIPSEATLTIKNGPAPFTCTGLRTASITSTTQSGGTTSRTTSPELRCAIPSDQTVFDGLKATLTIAGESVSDALTLPATAVEGRFREGNVYLPAETPGGKPTAQKVEIGISDGQYVEVKGGIEEGTSVLEFVPSIDPEDIKDDQTKYGMGE